MSQGQGQCRLLLAVFSHDPDEILLLPKAGNGHVCLLLFAFLGVGGITFYVLFARWHQKDCFQIFSEVSVLTCSSQILAYSLGQRRGINNSSAGQDHLNRRT